MRIDKDPGTDVVPQLFYLALRIGRLLVHFVSTPLTDDGNLMKTTEIIEPNTREFWQKGVRACAGKDYQVGLSPGSEKPNDL